MIRALILMLVISLGWLIVPPYLESYYEAKFNEKQESKREQMCIQAVRWQTSKCWFVDMTTESK